MEKIKDLWLTVLLKTRIKKVDMRLESVPSDEPSCCGPMKLCLFLEYKWFWEESSPPPGSCDVR